MIQRHFLKGVEINEPNNYPELQISRTWDNESESVAVNFDKVELGVGDRTKSNDGSILANLHIAAGLTGGVGVGEGAPYKLILDDQKGNVYEALNGYLDLWRSEQRCDKVIAPLVEAGGVDWSEQRLNSFTFEYLFNIGLITTDHFVPIPYVIEAKQNNLEIAFSLLTIFVVQDKIKEQALELKKSAGRLVSPFSASEVIAVIVQFIYVATLFSALVILVKDIVNNIIQKVKYHMGMYVKDLLEIGLSHIGLTLSSSIFQQPPFDKALIIPQKFNLKDTNTGDFEFIKGFFTPNKNEQFGYYKGTFGQLFNLVRQMVLAKVVIKNKIVYMEKRNFYLSTPKWKIPPVKDQFTTYNHEDFRSTYDLRFQVDINDRHTLQEYAGTAVTVTTQPKVILNKDMVLLSGLEEIAIGFSLGKAKTELTPAEKIVSGFLKGVNGIVKVFIVAVNVVISIVNFITRVINGILKALRKIGININNPIGKIPKISYPNFGSLIEDRIRMLKMESDYITIPKILLVDNHGNKRNNKLRSDNSSVLNARYLWDNYHYFNSFIPQKDSKGNQFQIKQFENIPFCFDDDQKVAGNNAIEDWDGSHGELIDIKYSPDAETASGTYRVQRPYTNNLIETIIEPNGK